MTDTVPVPGRVIPLNNTSDVEFLIKAGFSRPAAKEMVTKWQYLSERHPQFCPGLNEHAIEWLDDQFGQFGYNVSGDACGPDDDYGAAWLAMGVEPSLLPSLLAEKRKAVRLLTSASVALQESIRATADYMREINPTYDRMVVKRQHHARIQTEVDLPLEKEGHTMLYRVGPIFDLQDVWLSYGMTYTLAQLEVAELQCSYKASFARHVPFGILHIAVPDYLLTEQSNFLHVEDPAHWRKMVWQSRGRYIKPLAFWEGLSEDVAHYTAREQIGVAGSICAQSVQLLNRLLDETQVRPMKLANGEEAKQYVALRGAYNDLNEECEGLVWLEKRNLSEDGMRLMPSSGKAMTRAMGQ